MFPRTENDLKTESYIYARRACRLSRFSVGVLFMPLSLLCFQAGFLKDPFWSVRLPLPIHQEIQSDCFAWYAS